LLIFENVKFSTLGGLKLPFTDCTTHRPELFSEGSHTNTKNKHGLNVANARSTPFEWSIRFYFLENYWLSPGDLSRYIITVESAWVKPDSRKILPASSH
jgi:hypothetical protein